MCVCVCVCVCVYLYIYRGFNFVDERLLFGNWLTAEDGTIIEDFLVNMALNHNVQVEYSKTGECTFQAESPDEGAFVTGLMCTFCVPCVYLRCTLTLEGT